MINKETTIFEGIMLKKICYLIAIIINFNVFAEGRVILVTGASGDIGLGIAKHFVEKGDTVICHYFSNKRELEKLQQTSEKVYLLQADFGLPESIQVFWAEVLKCSDHIDIVINSAGIEQEEKALADTQRILNINYLSQRLVCDHAIEHFLQHKKGIIINLGSRAAYRGLPKGYYVYADSKAALTKYSYDIARDNAKNNILVYVIAPGPVEGKMFESLNPDVKEQCLSSMPTGQTVKVQEIVQMADFLASGKIPSATGGVFDLMGASWAH